MPKELVGKRNDEMERVNRVDLSEQRRSDRQTLRSRSSREPSREGLDRGNFNACEESEKDAKLNEANAVYQDFGTNLVVKVLNTLVLIGLRCKSKEWMRMLNRKRSKKSKESEEPTESVRVGSRARLALLGGVLAFALLELLGLGGLFRVLEVKYGV